MTNESFRSDLGEKPLGASLQKMRQSVVAHSRDLQGESGHWQKSIGWRKTDSCRHGGCASRNGVFDGRADRARSFWDAGVCRGPILQRQVVINQGPDGDAMLRSRAAKDSHSGEEDATAAAEKSQRDAARKCRSRSTRQRFGP